MNFYEKQPKDYKTTSASSTLYPNLGYLSEVEESDRIFFFLEVLKCIVEPFVQCEKTGSGIRYMPRKSFNQVDWLTQPEATEQRKSIALGKISIYRLCQDKQKIHDRIYGGMLWEEKKRNPIQENL